MRHDLLVGTEQLFAACGAKDKQLVWFEHGSHSHLRYYNTDLYDDTVAAFLARTDATISPKNGG